MQQPTTLPDLARPLVIWQLLDGRPGHQNQVAGLTEALNQLHPVHACEVRVNRPLIGFRSLLPGRLEPFACLPRPDLLIAAGHRTHLPLIRLQRRFGGQTIVLMKPSLPLSLFDLCLVPEVHQFRRLPANVILTEGALNRVQPSAILDDRQGLILIGGESSHFTWSDRQILEQICRVISRQPKVCWTLTTSRRTPDSFLNAWQRIEINGRMIPHQHTTPDWLPQQLQTCGHAWVTMDSVSMIGEALTAGAAVGLLELPVRRNNRITRGIHLLQQKQWVVGWSDWNRGVPLQRIPEPLNEAARCAFEVLRRCVPEISVPETVCRKLA